MKNFKIVIYLLIAMSNLISNPAHSQQLSMYGHEVPLQTTPGRPLRIMLVFVELTGGCAQNSSVDWPAGSVPVQANEYFDAAPSSNPQGYLTKYFYDMSMGQYIVLGDYVEGVVQISCSLATSKLIARGLVINELHNRYTQGTLSFHNGSNISDFDNLNTGMGSHFYFKVPNPDQYVDELVICYRNFSLQPCQTGFGCTALSPPQSNIFGNVGIATGCSFGICGNKENACSFIIEEMFHDMYGSNNWHLGGGSGDHTFPFATNPWGMPTQGAGYGSSNVASGWDREFCGWYGWLDLNKTIQKNDLVSSVSATGSEIPSSLQMPSSPTTTTYILRDFVNFGDAIKVKLPHINFISVGDVKNQYLWIENHQKQNSFDKSYWENVSCKDPWSRGLYCYIQVGKDVLQSTALIPIETGLGEQPNGLASWLFPLTAEGNFDYEFGSDYEDLIGDPCIWFNKTKPTKPYSSGTLPNPLTGFSDLYSYFNSDGNGELNRATDLYQPGLSEIDNSGNLIFNGHSRGDSKDAFSFANGNTKLSMSSNPSTCPVLTKQSADNLALPVSQSFATFENRKIWLNGLAIQIIQENVNPVMFGQGAVMVNVRWDDYDIDQNVRWCADDIELSPNDFNVSNPSLNLLAGKQILLDRGSSATHSFEQGTDANGNFLFTRPTTLNCLPSSFIKMNPGSKFIVDNGSVIDLQGNSKIEMESGSQIYVRNGSKLILESNSLLHLKDGASVIIENGGKLEYHQDADIKLDAAASFVEIQGTLELMDNSNFKFSSTTNDHGYFKFNNTSLFPSKNIFANNNCSINLVGSNQNRKVLEVDQETFYAPANLDLLSITNGKVVFNTDSRLQADGLATIINFNNVKFTSNTPGQNNGHRGVHLYGQPNVTISSCIFEYGMYGIFAYLTYGGSPLTVTNSTFRHNTFGVKSYDKGLNLFQCNFFNNEFGAYGGHMSFPSTFFEGLVGGGIANANTYGIRWQGYSTSSLTLDDPYINTNTLGVRIDNCPVFIKCGSISFNHDGIVFNHGANLFMDDQVAIPNAASVSVFNNDFSIHTVKGWYMWLNKGYNDLSPSSISHQRSAFGILIGQPYTIVANVNKWNFAGTLTGADYNLTDVAGNPYTISDQYPQSSILACGQAIPACPNPPCPNQSPLEYCPSCDVINTDDFMGVKLNLATKEAIDKMNSNDENKYSESVKLFYQILNETYSNPDAKEKYLLSLNYIKMMIALGSAYKANEVVCLESGIPDFVSDVISIQDKFIDQAINDGNYDYRFKYSMDKAQTLRIACQRQDCLNLLNDISGWVEGDDDIAAVNQFICGVGVELKVISGEILPEDVEVELAQCGISNERSRNPIDQPSIADVSPELQVQVKTLHEPSSIELKTNAEIANVVLVNSLGQILFENEINYDCVIDGAKLAAGIYLISVTDMKTMQIVSTKVVLN